MNKGLLKGLVLGGIFFIAVIIMEIVTNTSGVDLTSDMKEATLPVVYLSENNRIVNELFGYTQKMNPAYMRDSITPIYGDLSLPVKIKTYNNKIDRISYEVRSLDTNRLIEDTKVEQYQEKNGVLETTLQIQNIIDPDEEYLLIFTIESKGKKIDYFTRIIRTEDSNIKECVNFAMDFHKKTFDKEQAASLSTYLETDSTEENSTLHKVNIHSTLDQVSWGSFNASKLSTPVISIKEIKNTYSVISLSYSISRKESAGEFEYYNVEESYRIRYSKDRMYLLDFERTMSQIYRGESGGFSDKKLLLGIRSPKVDYLSNENGTNVCFVQEGELWSYNENTDSLARVFSFRSFEGFDSRENNADHEIKIIKVDETGSADFIVYGYMPRGKQEGKVGISVYHYDSVANTVEEELWIPFTKSYQVIKEEVGRIMYVNESNMFYLMVDGVVYKIDLATRKKEIVAQGSGEEWYAASPDNSKIAWIDGKDENSGTTLHIYDMEKETDFVLISEEGEYIRPLGFLKTDFIYGIAKSKKVKTDAAGNTVFPMHKLIILDKKNKQVKTYHKSGYYVSGIEIIDYTIYLNRLRNKKGSYVEVSQDTIVNLSGEAAYPVALDQIVTEEKQTEMQLILADEIKDKTPRVLTPKQVMVKEERVLSLEKEDAEGLYYAYSRGKVLLATTKVGKAVMEASANMGVVIDARAQYVWERARDSYKNTLPDMKADTEKVGTNEVERCLSVMLKSEGVNVSVHELLDNGNTPKEILADTMQNTVVLDLTGCTLEEILYYVSRGTPVYALKSAHSPVLVVGYDSDSIVLYDPKENTTYSKKKEEVNQMFEEAGNIFLAYIKE